MDTLTTMPVTKKQSCLICSINKLSKINLTKMSSPDYDMNNQELAGQNILVLQYINELSEKYEKLEQKVGKLQNTIFQLRKKNVDDYVKSLPPCPMKFGEWTQKCIVTDKALQSLFDKDMRECLKTVIYQTIEESSSVPLKAFTQRPNTIFIYDQIKDGSLASWRAITHEELEKFTRILGHRILKKYVEWAKEHSNLIDCNAQQQELSICYLNKANCSSMTLDQRLSEIRKTIIANVQISLKNLE